MNMLLAVATAMVALQVSLTTDRRSVAVAQSNSWSTVTVAVATEQGHQLDRKKREESELYDPV